MPRTRTHLSLKAKIAFFMLALIVASVPLAAHLILTLFRNELTHTIEAQQQVLVTRIAGELDDKIRTAQGALIDAASSVPATALATPDRAARFLRRLTGLNALFDNGTFLFTPEGALIVGTGLSAYPPGSSFADREYLRTTRASGKPYISAPFTSRQAHHHPIIMFTAPVVGRDGKMTAILCGSFDLMQQNCLGTLAATKIGQTGFFYLFTTGRQLIMHPDRQRLLGDSLLSGYRDYAALVAERGAVTVRTTNRRGIPVISTFVRLQTVAWVLAADYPVSEAYAPVKSAVRSAWWGIVPGGFFLVAAMWLFMRHLTQPIVRLKEQIRQTEETGIYRNVLITSGDEIAEVAEAFNSLMNRLHEKEDKLYHLSTHDAMTGLYNRLFFEAELERINRGRNYPVSIIMADLDNLKLVNDTLGHAAGDTLIAAAARALREAFRAEDVVARIGGDEFAVLLESTDTDAAAEAIGRIREAVVRCNGPAAEAFLSLSLGAATAATASQLYETWKLADQRMYAEKGRRKSRRRTDTGHEG